MVDLKSIDHELTLLHTEIIKIAGIVRDIKSIIYMEYINKEAIRNQIKKETEND